MISCPDCGREFAPGVSWPNANYCRASFLLPVIAESPNLSAWELSQRTGMAYQATVKALEKAREWNALQWFEEPREDGDGVRYRYRRLPGQEVRLKCRGK